MWGFQIAIKLNRLEIVRISWIHLKSSVYEIGIHELVESYGTFVLFVSDIEKA